jgi:hypothetical protein
MRVPWPLVFDAKARPFLLILPEALHYAAAQALAAIRSGWGAIVASAKHFVMSSCQRIATPYIL